jgi:hypothetical protein
VTDHQGISYSYSLSSPEPMRKQVINMEEYTHAGKRLKFNMELIEEPVEYKVPIMPLRSIVKVPKEFPEEHAPPEIKVSKVVYAGEKRARKTVKAPAEAPAAKKRKV